MNAGLVHRREPRGRRSKPGLHACVLVWALLLCAPAAAQVVKVTIDDMIHPISDEVIGRAIDYARNNHADAVLIELSTPGGLVDSTRSIVSKVLSSPAPVVVYVAPTGARAASAGFFILEAADVAAMAPGTNTGAAHPVTIGGGDKLDPVMKEKMENDAAAFMRSYTSKRGRNSQAAESAVRQSKSFTDQEAMQQHLIDVVARDREDLFRQLDGRTVTRFDGNKVTLHLAGKPVHEVPYSLKQRILSFIMDPNVAFVLLAVGMLALYAEFNHPGAVVPGVVGFIFILLAVFALNILPTNYAAVALILLGFTFFALEAKYSAHGVLGLGGIVALTLGGLLLVDGPIPAMRVHLSTALAVSVPLGAITMFLMALVVQARRKKSMTGIEGLVGAVGVARSPLSPEGKVFIQGELWNAVSPVAIGVGEPVRVREVEGLLLHVEPAKN
ncbi:MAG TPA: nodulation protein NfeD [Terriglobales bacterium]|nr:nodulation protein NfeD [Terriglobales bacterium]